MCIELQVAALQQARLVRARAEEAEATRRAKAEEIARRKEIARVAKVPAQLLRAVLCACDCSGIVFRHHTLTVRAARSC